MSIAINSNFGRDQIVANFTGQTVFTYSFPIYSDLFISVYKRAGAATPDDPTQLLTLGVDYTVQGVGEAAGGTITLTVGAILGDIITMVGTQPIERESIFQDLNPFTVALNQQLNQLTIMMQQNYTYWANLTPHYNFDELVSAPSGANAGVRPFKLILPMLPNGHTWVGRGSIGNIPDDITTQPVAGPGTGNVVAANPGMRQSITQWTGVDFVITDSDIFITNAIFGRTAGALEDRTGFNDAWGAMHWPAHNVAERPLVPANGDTYYDNTLQEYFGFKGGSWVPFTMGANNPQIRTITQANTFNPQGGQWLYVEDATGLYKLASAMDAALAETWYVTLSATPTSFVVQSGTSYLDAGTIANPFFSALTPGVWFISDTSPGDMTLVQPTAVGHVSKPVFIADSANTGWILSATGYIIGTTSGGGTTTHDHSIVDVNQPGNTFGLGDVIYALPAPNAGKYALATASGTFAQADRVGVVITPGNPNFQYQTEGEAIGAILADDTGAAIDPGVRYWLSVNPLTPGKVTKVQPTTPGQYTVPVYMPYAAGAGIITPQRPLIVPTNGGGGTGPIVQSITSTNNVRSDLTLNATWVTYPGLSVTITPTAATSRLKITGFLTMIPYPAASCQIRLVRDGVPVVAGLGTNPSGVLGVAMTTAPNLSSSSLLGSNSSFLVSDPAVSAVPTTYTIEVRANTGATPVVFGINTNQVGAGGNRDAGISTLTVEEVA